MLIPLQIRVTERQLEQLKQLAATRENPPSVPRTVRWLLDQAFGNLPAQPAVAVPKLPPPPPPAPPPEPEVDEPYVQDAESLAIERAARAQREAEQAAARPPKRELAAWAAKESETERIMMTEAMRVQREPAVPTQAPPPERLTRAQFDALPPAAKDTIRAQGRAPATTIAERIAAADRALAARPPEPPPPTDPAELVEYNADRMRRGLAPVQ